MKLILMVIKMIVLMVLTGLVMMVILPAMMLGGTGGKFLNEVFGFFKEEFNKIRGLRQSNVHS